YGMKINKIHAAVSKNVESFKVFAELFSLVNVEGWKSAVLLQIQNETAEANVALKELDRLANWFDQRLNSVAYALLTGFFVYDLQCVSWLEAWKTKHQAHLRRWLAAIGEVEMLNSLATFHFNNPDYAFPKMTEGAPFIEATALAHPLIPAHERVSNDFNIGINKQLYIVTGSNMSGKSTFLRTVGVNLLLARMGAPVCATHFAGTPMAIHSSLRQSDSLQDHVSTFYAELKTLQEILHHLEENPYALVLLDEVLRGTNSDDKLYGSQQLVRRLLSLGCVGLLATHDIELAKMEREYPETLGNLCFESIIEDDNLYFDYQLKTGTAQNRNATFLMQKMGIIRK
ncbi:MAG: MutS-related protein, partial [Saprospiraceae bacterium]